MEREKSPSWLPKKPRQGQISKIYWVGKLVELKPMAFKLHVCFVTVKDNLTKRRDLLLQCLRANGAQVHRGREFVSPVFHTSINGEHTV